MKQEFITRMHTYFEVAMHGVRKKYKALKYLPTRDEILQYCRSKGLSISCVSQIVSFQITDVEPGNYPVPEL